MRSPLLVATQSPRPCRRWPGRARQAQSSQRPPVLAVEARQPLRGRRPDRAVAAARDRMHELAGQPFVFAPAPQLPFLPAADARQRRVVGRAAVEQDAGQAGRERQRLGGALARSPVRAGAARRARCRARSRWRRCRLRRRPRWRRAGRPTACWRARRPRTTRARVVLAGSSSATLCRFCQSVLPPAPAAAYLVIARPPGGGSARDRVDAALRVGGQRQRHGLGRLADARLLRSGRRRSARRAARP